MFKLIVPALLCLFSTVACSSSVAPPAPKTDEYIWLMSCGKSPTGKGPDRDCVKETIRVCGFSGWRMVSLPTDGEPKFSFACGDEERTAGSIARD